MRERVVQLDGPAADPRYATRARDLTALSRFRGRIAARLGRERLALASRARRSGSRVDAVAAVRAGEAQAAAEVLQRNAAVQAGLAQLMAIASARGDETTIATLIEQFNRLADQSEVIAPNNGRVGLSGLAGIGEYVPPPPGATTLTLVKPATVDRVRTASGPVDFPPAVAAVLDPIKALNPSAVFFWQVGSNGALVNATAVGQSSSGAAAPIRLPDSDAAAVRIKVNAADFGEANLARQGAAPYKLGPGGLWFTYNTLAASGRPVGTLRIYYPTDSPLEGLPEAISDAWDKVQAVARAAANLACDVASNGVVQSAAMKLGPSAAGTVAAVNGYACPRASKPDEKPAETPSAGGGAVKAIGLAAVLAALLSLA